MLPASFRQGRNLPRHSTRRINRTSSLPSRGLKPMTGIIRVAPKMVDDFDPELDPLGQYRKEQKEAERQ